MDNNIATICVIAVGVGLLIMIGGALLLSVMRGSVFGLGMMVMRMVSEPPKEETKIDVTAVSQSATPDLRAQAQSLDFDATVEKYRKNDPQAASPFPTQSSPRTQGFPPPNTPPPKDNGPLHQ